MSLKPLSGHAGHHHRLQSLQCGRYRPWWWLGQTTSDLAYRGLVSYLPLFLLELFSGTGRLTTSLASSGLATLDPFEIYDGWEFDLTWPSTQALLFQLVSTGLIWYIHAGIPCAVWSRARHNIANFAKARARELVPVELTMFCVALFWQQTRLEIQHRHGFSSSDLFWNLVGYPLWSLWDMCGYDQPFRKSTGMLTNLINLKVLARSCLKNHQHIQLRGTERYVMRQGCWRRETRHQRLVNILGVFAMNGALQFNKQLQLRRGRQTPLASRCLSDNASKKLLLSRSHTPTSLKPITSLTLTQHKSLSRGHGRTIPIVFGQRNAKEAAWLKQQGAWHRKEEMKKVFNRICEVCPARRSTSHFGSLKSQPWRLGAIYHSDKPFSYLGQGSSQMQFRSHQLDSWLNTYWSCMKMGCMFGKEPISSTASSF